MKRKDSLLFLIMAIVMVLSFLLCGYSLIRVFVIGYEGEDIGSHIFEISYLFVHLIVVAILFYLYFRAYKFGSFFTKGLTVDQNGVKYHKKHIVFAIIGSLLVLIAIYSTLQIIGLKFPLYDFMGEVIWHDLMNGCYLLSVIFISFFIYPYVADIEKTAE